jgi:transglutaminase-like putative cysteine protease
MTPMTTPAQQTLRARVEVRPSSWETTYVDYWGTQVTAFELLRPHDQLEVTARSVVELEDVTSLAGSATGPGSGAASTRLGWAELASPAVRDEQVEMLLLTRRTAPPDELADELAGWAGTATPDQVARRVCDLVHDRVSYVPGASEVSTTAADAWAAGAGVCQDIGHLCVGALRTVGIPARYVSGYFDPRPDPQPGEVATAQSHAWVEWWTGDWTAYDPTNAVVPDDRHVVVGRGRDYGDVTPLKGIYSGSSSSTLFVEVQIRRLG